MGTGDESVSSVSNKIKLNFNHPCKELVWVVQKDSVVDSTTMEDYCGKQWFNYTDGIDESWTTGTPVDVFGGGLVNGHMVLDGLNTVMMEVLIFTVIHSQLLMVKSQEIS